MKQEHCLNPKILEQIKAVHQLSQNYNSQYAGGHQAKLLDLIREHIDEIEELASVYNPHFLVETGDLLILCFELLIENNQSIDGKIVECIGRYEKKLTALIAQKENLKST